MTDKAEDFYTIIQWYPGQLRLEGINVGVILFMSKNDLIVHRLIENFMGLHRRFPMVNIDGKRLLSSMNALVARIVESQIVDLDSLEEFINKESGPLRLTKPRNVIVNDHTIDFDDLFKRLVEK